MTELRYNLLDEPHIRVLPLGVLTLPGLMAALARDEVEGFPALRPHQAPLWHMFLVQLAALALHGAGEREIPADEQQWGSLLRGLTRDFPGDEPWCLLVNDWTQPAFMQPPVPPEVVLKSDPILSPDALDLLITAKNHDIKKTMAHDGAVEDWVYALVTHQTGGTYNIQNANTIRTGNLYAPRICMGLAPMSLNGHVNQFPCLGAWFNRDVQTLLEYRSNVTEIPLNYLENGGIGLTWIVPWQNGKSLRTSELDIWFIEACRRIRITSNEVSINALIKSEKTPRIVSPDSKCIGDPWTPEHKTDNKTFSLTEKGFHYYHLVEVLFGNKNSQDWILPVLLLPTKNDLDKSNNLIIVFYGVAGEKKKTGTLGFYSRILPLSGKISRALGPKRAELHQLAKKQMETIEKFDKALRDALVLAAAKGDRDRIKKELYSFTNTARSHLDRYADTIFFERLWARFEMQELGEQALRAEEEEFSRLLWERTCTIFDEALPAMPCTGLFRHRAEARARRMLHIVIRKIHPELFSQATTPDTDKENTYDAST